ncbi:MAG TPA: hypothetical protein VKU41_27800 [Polyangiaceae bacterium]|nr:hypothetical protein [Polyangiaceae bacterium]
MIGHKLIAIARTLRGESHSMALQLLVHLGDLQSQANALLEPAWSGDEEATRELVRVRRALLDAQASGERMVLAAALVASSPETPRRSPSTIGLD